MFKIDISVIIIALNEEKNIQRCLDSLTWVNEIILTDSGSKDATIEIAQQYPNVKIIHTDWLGFAPTRKLAVRNTSNHWILVVDADEVVTKALKNEILGLHLNPNDQIFAFDFPRKTFFMGEWVKYCGWYPGRVIRLFNKEFCNYNNNELHEEIDCPKQNLGHLNADLEHFSYQTVSSYFHKMNAYGLDGAKNLVQRKKKFSVMILILNPLFTFFKFYILKKGFLDGKKGLIISIGSSFSGFIKYVNLYYLEKKS
jgi:(heptosyl)LPS beta-1,4-glucosyltransferase